MVGILKNVLQTSYDHFEESVRYHDSDRTILSELYSVKHPGLYSQNFIFFLTYEWAQ